MLIHEFVFNLQICASVTWRELIHYPQILIISCASLLGYVIKTQIQQSSISINTKVERKRKQRKLHWPDRIRQCDQEIFGFDASKERLHELLYNMVTSTLKIEHRENLHRSYRRNQLDRNSEYDRHIMHYALLPANVSSAVVCWMSGSGQVDR